MHPKCWGVNPILAMPVFWVHMVPQPIPYRLCCKKKTTIKQKQFVEQSVIAGRLLVESQERRLVVHTRAPAGSNQLEFGRAHIAGRGGKQRKGETRRKKKR